MKYRDRIWRINGSGPPDPFIAEASARLARDGVVIYPTETFYGLGANPFSADAVLRAYRIKRRSLAKAMPLIASDIAAVRNVAADWSPSTDLLVRAFWPGPLTLILPTAVPFPSMLLTGPGKIAVRVSSHPVAGALATAVGGLVTATSANIAGSSPIADPAEIPPDLLREVDGMLDAGTLPGNLPSTVLDVSRPVPRLVREGCLPAELIARALSRRTSW